MIMSISRQEMEEIATRAAERALRELFRLLDVDLTKPEAITLLRRDLEAARRLRLLGEQVSSTLIRTIVGVAILAMLAAFVLGARVQLGLGASAPPERVVTESVWP